MKKKAPFSLFGFFQVFVSPQTPHSFEKMLFTADFKARFFAVGMCGNAVKISTLKRV